ncbi:hypothetical protein PAECIP111891_02071 [Paenibacillus allorhizoplanae]|uniref:Uncharacterized protein n=1 Tax=Paenibacillus allorhizoplanae TaxID=2905648 RepID=A0ABM9C2M2_9BACL|nr:hypothetical protein [Paenibacillus allorhizoplanae]CAH1202230.1 hypothetical protein PAECIP111891_02071 [Paenibacillus allorhizoplanae]
MSSEFTLDLCFIREQATSPFYTIIEQQLTDLFTGKGTWYMDLKEEQGLEIVVVEVKGMAMWESEDEVIGYIEESAESDETLGYDCWSHLHGYQVKVTPKADAGCCRLKKEAVV